MLEPQEKAMLEKALDLAEKNNKIITKMYHAQRVARVFHILYWVLVIGSAVGAYYVIQPYIEGITDGFSENVDKVKHVFESLPTE